jgi:hypothetical protein
MRIIASTSRPSEADSSLTQDEVAELTVVISVLASRHPERESYCEDDINQKMHHVALVSYQSPNMDNPATPIVRWAVLVEDPANLEYLDCESRAEAEGHYEAEVRALAGCTPGEPYWEHTDVEDLPGKK